MIILRQQSSNHDGTIIIPAKNLCNPRSLCRFLDDVNVSRVKGGLKPSQPRQSEFVIFDPELRGESAAVVDHDAAVGGRDNGVFLGRKGAAAGFQSALDEGFKRLVLTRVGRFKLGHVDLVPGMSCVSFFLVLYTVL